MSLICSTIKQVLSRTNTVKVTSNIFYMLQLRSFKCLLYFILQFINARKTIFNEQY